MEFPGFQADIERADSATTLKWSEDGNFDVYVTGSYEFSDSPGLYKSSDWVLGPGHTGYANPEMKDLIRQLGIATGPSRHVAAATVSALFEKDLPYIPTGEYAEISAGRIPYERFHTGSTYLYYVKWQSSKTRRWAEARLIQCLPSGRGSNDGCAMVFIYFVNSTLNSCFFSSVTWRSTRTN